MSPICRRKTWSVLALFCALALPALAANPVARPAKQYTIEQFMATTRVSGASFSPDEKEILFSSNQTGIFNVYRIPVAGGPAVPVTSSTTDTTLAVSFFPTDRRVLYTRDQGGNELNHLYPPDAAELARVRPYVLPTGKHEEVEKAEWAISYRFFSRGGAYRVTGVNEDARTVIRIVETASGKPVALPKLPEGDVTSVRISDSEK